MAVAEAAAATRANIASDAAGQNNGADARDRPNSLVPRDSGRGLIGTCAAQAHKVIHPVTRSVPSSVRQ